MRIQKIEVLLSIHLGMRVFCKKVFSYDKSQPESWKVSCVEVSISSNRFRMKLNYQSIAQKKQNMKNKCFCYIMFKADNYRRCPFIFKRI
jgi:hypothetical protein